MFEALFILTTIDAGTRIARFLLQETVGRVYKPFARPDWLPGALIASGAVTAGYGVLISTGEINTIWPMFGIANQLLAVMALALVTTWMVNQGRGRFAWVTVIPMLFVTSTTLTAGVQLINGRFAKMIERGQKAIAKGQEMIASAPDMATAGGKMVKEGQTLLLTGYLNSAMTIFVIACVCTVLLWAIARCLSVALGKDVKTTG